MAHPQLLADWQAAEQLAEAAQAVCSEAIKTGGVPTTAQLEEAARLRSIASSKLQAMVTDLKPATRLCA